MSSSNIKITISGPGVLPETTRVSDLAQLLVNIETSIFETAKSQGLEIGEENIVSLTQVDRSSNKLTFTVAALLLPAVSVVSEAVEKKRYESIPRQAHEALHSVSKQAVKKNWEVKFEEDISLKIRGGTISEENKVTTPPVHYVEGTTSIYGRCIRVGGLKPRAEIQLYQGPTLYISINEQLARDLAKNLYDEVCIEGRAKWNNVDWAIEEFEGTRITSYRSTDPVTAFKSLADAAGSRWDEVDAIEYVRVLRSEREKK